MKTIPKKIHYCWFGRGKKSKETLNYIASWRKYCPDYEIIEWNEDNFDISCNPYVKEAYDAKKYAFVSDYVRLYVLYNFGGIYMDTDVELIKNLDEFLSLPAFSGIENSNMISTGIMASCKKNKWLKLLLDNYQDRHFLLANGEYDLTTNVVFITNLTVKKYNIKLNDSYQNLGDVVIYPSYYFSPKDHDTGLINLTKETVCIHHFSGSWLPKWQQQEEKRKRELTQKYGAEKGLKILKIELKCKYVLQIPFKIVKKIYNLIRGQK